MPYLVPEKELRKHLAQDSEVDRAQKRVANRLGAVAEAKLAMHKAAARLAHASGKRSKSAYTAGNHKIEVHRMPNVKYGHIDWFVSLEGQAPVSLEFGHNIKTRSGKVVGYAKGTYIMTTTLASAV
jgi:hypothetical protein